MYKVFCINICRCKTNDYFRWQLTQANVNFNVRAVKNLANLADCSAVVVKCEGQCVCVCRGREVWRTVCLCVPWSWSVKDSVFVCAVVVKCEGQCVCVCRGREVWRTVYLCLPCSWSVKDSVFVSAVVVKCEGQCICVCRGREVWRTVYLCLLCSWSVKDSVFVSAVVVKCEGQCICSVSSANPLLWSLYRGLAFSLLLEIYEYSDRNVTNNLHLFAAPKSPCSSDERLETSAGLQTLAVNCCCNNACAGVHIGVLTAGNLRNLDGHAVPCTQHGVPQAQLFLINYRTFL